MKDYEVSGISAKDRRELDVLMAGPRSACEKLNETDGGAGFVAVVLIDGLLRLFVTRTKEDLAKGLVESNVSFEDIRSVVATRTIWTDMWDAHRCSRLGPAPGGGGDVQLASASVH